MAHDVFISYSSQDKSVADAACARLEGRGIRCWIAPRDIPPGAEFAEAIVNAIGAARVMLLVFSANANESQHVRREIERAVHRGMPILPLRVEDVTPSGAMDYYLAGQHWLDAITEPLEEHLEKLGDAVQALLEASGAARGPESPPVTPVPESPSELYSRALAAHNEGRLDEARPLVERAIAMHEAAPGPPDVTAASAYNLLGVICYTNAQYERALELYRTAVEIAERQRPPTPRDLAQMLSNLAFALGNLQRHEEARPALERALELREQACGPHSAEVAESALALAQWHRLAGELRAALPLYERAATIFSSTRPPTDTHAVMCVSEMTALRRDLGPDAS